MAREIVAEAKTNPRVGRNLLLTALSIGAFVGFFGWILTIAINSWVLDPVFCRSADSVSACANSGMTAWIIAHILMSVAGLFMLIRVNVFRPLLVVIATIITLWTIGLWFLPLAWWVGAIWETIFFALAYALYTWLIAQERFIYALVTTVALVVVFRVLISL